MEYLYEKILETQKIPQAFMLWEHYRKEVTDFILANCADTDRIAVLGAGSCNDLDLKRLAARNGSTILLDMDVPGMECAKDRQLGRIPNCNIGTQYFNIWPVCAVQYHQLEQMFYNRCPMNEIILWMEQVEEQTMENVPQMQEKQYDVMVCIGLFSQVNIMFITLLKYYQELYSVSYSMDEIRQYTKAVQKMNQDMTNCVMTELKKSAKTLILGYEYSTFFQNDDRIYDVKECFETGRASKVYHMGLSRVEGAWQLERWIGDAYAADEFDITAVSYKIWPVVPQKNYLMVFYVCKKK